MIDLHCHTTFSDGVADAEGLVKEALAFGLEALAITDHDNTQSYAIAQRVAEGSSLEIIPAIEINTVWEEYDEDIHILGYYIDPTYEPLQAIIQRHRQARLVQIEKIVDHLRQQNRVNITFEDVLAKSGELGTLGRPHVAHTLVEKGITYTIGEAFHKYLNRKSSVYERRKTVSPHEAVEAIEESGGIAVIAHPGDIEKMEQLVEELMDYGLRGLEAYHKSHNPATIERHCTLAEQYGLIVTGGTDYHGPADSYQNALSRLFTPAYVYEKLKAEYRNKQQASFKAV